MRDIMAKSGGAGKDICCFICGFTSEEWRNMRSQPEATGQKPFFPFLLNQEPAAGSLELTETGTACVCILCYTLLEEQWNIYEDGNIHRQKRLYWMKRPEKTRKFTTREKSVMKTLVIMESQDNIAENGVKPFADVLSPNIVSCVKSTKSRTTSNSSEILFNSLAKKSTVNDEEICCYLCSDKILFSERKLILTEASPTRDQSVRYYPCFQNIKPPHSTKVHIKNGDIFSCQACEVNLKNQWDKFDKLAVPISFRTYAMRKEHHSFCYCCGNMFIGRNNASIACDLCVSTFCQVCRQPNKATKDSLINVRLTQKDEFHSLGKFFPEGIRNIWSCKLCVSHLSSQKRLFDEKEVPRTQRKYTVPAGSGSNGNQKIKQVVCYLCGESYKADSKVYYLFAEKQGESENSPFFPILKNLNPAEGANIMSKEGVVFTCRFCYHNLIAQWNWYEVSDDPRQKSNRQYSLNICCVICTKSVARPKVRVIGKTQFPFLPHLPRDPRCILLDNFDCVVVCNPCERTLVMQWLDYENRSVPAQRREYHVSGRNFRVPAPSTEKSLPPKQLPTKEVSAANPIAALQKYLMTPITSAVISATTQAADDTDLPFHVFPTSSENGCSLYKALKLAADTPEAATDDDGCLNLSISEVQPDDQPQDLSLSGSSAELQSRKRKCDTELSTLQLCDSPWDDIKDALAGCSDENGLRKLEIEHCKLILLHDNYKRKLLELENAEKPFTAQLSLVGEMYSQLKQT